MTPLSYPNKLPPEEAARQQKKEAQVNFALYFPLTCTHKTFSSCKPVPAGDVEPLQGGVFQRKIDRDQKHVSRGSINP